MRKSARRRVEFIDVECCTVSTARVRICCVYGSASGDVSPSKRTEAVPPPSKEVWIADSTAPIVVTERLPNRRVNGIIVFVLPMFNFVRFRLAQREGMSSRESAFSTPRASPVPKRRRCGTSTNTAVAPATPRLVSLNSSSSTDVVVIAADSLISKRWPGIALLFARKAEQQRLLAALPPALVSAAGNLTNSEDDAAAAQLSEDDEKSDANTSCNGVDEQLDFILEAGAVRLCDLMPPDTVRCTIDGDKW